MLSIIVPVYKVEAYLNRCIDSILAQTFTDFELILVDDGSPDNCGTICDEYAGKDSRITVIHQENGGLSAARNAGIEYALKTDSEWISFIDSDDWIHPDYFTALSAAATRLNVNISVCGFQRTSGEEKESGNTEFRALTPEEFWCKERIKATVAWGKLYRKNLFHTIRYPVGKIHEDEFTTYRLLFSCEKLAVSDAAFYYYFQNSNGIMNSEWTPKRLVQFDAFRDQVAYFEKNHFSSALKNSERELINACVKNYYDASANPAYLSYAREIKDLLKAEYQKNKKALHLNIRSDAKIYLILYPVRTKIFLKIPNFVSVMKSGGIKGVFRKIKSGIFPPKND